MIAIKRLLALALMAAGTAQAAQIPAIDLSMVSDDATPSAEAGSNPEGFRTIDGVLYFAAQSPGLGVELYRTDGTPEGLHLVRDFAPGPASSYPVPLGSAGGKLIVMADDGVHGAQLWALAPDGAATRVTAEVPTQPLFAVRPVGKVGDRLLTYALEALWSTDGTSGGTVDLSAVTDLGVDSTALECNLGDRIVIAPIMRGWGTAIARVDGTAQGSRRIGTPPADILNGIAAEALDGRCYFFYSTSSNTSRYGWTVLESDGTEAGTRVVASSTTATAFGMASLGGTLYLTVAEASRLRLLRRTPGTDTFAQVAELSGTRTDYTGGMRRIGNLLGFGGPYQPQLAGTESAFYVSDGTQAGTRRVFPVPGAPPEQRFYGYGSNAPGGRFLLGDPVVFLNDATLQMTAMPQLGSDFYTKGAVVGGTYVSVAEDETGREVWRTDGSPAGTRRLYDLWPGTKGSVGRYYGIGLVQGETVYTVSKERLGSANQFIDTVVRSDGTPGGLRVLPPNAHPDGLVTAIVPLGDGIAFAMTDPHLPNEWRTWYRADAQLTGATPLTGSIAASSEPMTAGGRLVFGCATTSAAADGLCGAGVDGTFGVFRTGLENARRLMPIGKAGDIAVFSIRGTVWRSDGTLPGTFIVFDPPGEELPGAEYVLPGVEWQGKLYFGNCGAEPPCSLLATDGTAIGTTAVAALPTGAVVQASAPLGNRLVVVTATDSNVQLWSSDGTGGGTRLLLNIARRGTPLLAVVGDRALLRLCAGSACRTVVTDGTSAGTRQIDLPMTVETSGELWTAIGAEALLFSCTRPSTGGELCVMDRDGQHARLLADVYPGPTGSSPWNSFVARTEGGTVYLVLDDGVNGSELWRVRELSDAIFADDFD